MDGKEFIEHIRRLLEEQATVPKNIGAYIVVCAVNTDDDKISVQDIYIKIGNTESIENLRKFVIKHWGLGDPEIKPVSEVQSMYQ